MTKTPNLNLNVPDYRDQRWDTPVNENWNLIDAAVAGKQDVQTAVNYDNITNCITEIPQNISLELNNNGYILKDGSKVYMPNGFESDGVTPKFDEIICSQDLSYVPTWGAGYRCFLTGKINANGELASINMIREDYIASGDTEPTSPPSSMTWYDTKTNKIKTYRGDAWKTDDVNEPRLLPFGIVTVTTGNVISSIDQVFNGFGYIGSTVFALPGVKGLVPNGRNEDGSLKNIEFTKNNVSIWTTQPAYSWDAYIVTQARTGIYALGTNDYLYNETENYNYFNGSNNNSTWLCKITQSSGKITSFTPKTAFRALDYNDSSTISGWAMPSSRYINLTLGASGTTYTAPANGYIVFEKTASAAGQLLALGVSNSGQRFAIYSYANNQILSATIPVKKGQVSYVSYSVGGATKIFRFIYAEGEN